MSGRIVMMNDFHFLQLWSIGVVHNQDELANIAIKGLLSDNEKYTVTKKLSPVGFDPTTSQLSIQHSNYRAELISFKILIFFMS